MLINTGSSSGKRSAKHFRIGAIRKSLPLSALWHCMSDLSQMSSSPKCAAWKMFPLRRKTRKGNPLWPESGLCPVTWLCSRDFPHPCSPPWKSSIPGIHTVVSIMWRACCIPLQAQHQSAALLSKWYRALDRCYACYAPLLVGNHKLNILCQI